ncbi:MAG TPA: alpha/beta hydrolase, partial [Candidatus Dormibacteraeota bacterium]|nr:alpha/beta hydrolase [Candidatus Dormibacteraeota bacterium]
MASEVDIKTLKVPGASIYYEVRGSGPALLCIPGGPADAGAFHPLAGELAPNYTVITYDPRGLSRSPLEGPFDDAQAIEINADDAYRLIRAVTDGKANVLASSGGATISLELARQHPEAIATLVPHEIPSAAFQEDPARARDEFIDITDTFKAAGLGAAFPKFAAAIRLQAPPPAPPSEPTPEQLEGMAMMQRNMDFWFGHTMRAIGLYEPDIEALNSGSCRIVSGVGEESAGEPAHDSGLRLAQVLGTEAAVFPGAHGGFESHAPAF